MQTSPNLLSSASLPFPSSDRKEKKRLFGLIIRGMEELPLYSMANPWFPIKSIRGEARQKRKEKKKEEDAIRISFTPDDRRSLQTGKRK